MIYLGRVTEHPELGQGPGEPLAPPIPADYYWRNFRVVVDTVLEHRRALLSPQELEHIEALLACSKPAQQLFVRLLSRKGELFRRSRLGYGEIPDIDAAVEELAAAGFLAVDPDELMAGPEVLGALTVPELKQLAAHHKLPTGGRKDELLGRLADADAAGTRAWLRKADRFLVLQRDPPFLVAQVLFFGNRHQDLTEFVLVDLRISSYEEVEIDYDHPLFPDRAALEEYLLAAARWDAGYAAAEELDLETLGRLGGEAWEALARREALPAYRRRVDPARYDERLIYLAARELERAGLLAEGAASYRHLLRHGLNAARVARAADRLGLVLHRLGRRDELPPAVEPWLHSGRLDDISRHRIERRLARMKFREDPRRQLREPELVEFELESAGYQGTKALYRCDDGEARVVELAVLERLGGDGLWCENGLYTTLTGLLLWDEIFAPLPGMFQHPFQHGPLDWGSDDFHANRAELVTARLAALRDADVPAEVDRAWEAHHGRRCSGVHWDAFPRDQVVRAAAALGPALLDIVQRIARHPRRHRRGLPDLLVWQPGGVLLVEVKGPGDQPSVEQVLWHDFLVRRGLPVRLARVTRA